MFSQKIKDHLIKFCEKNDWETSEGDLIECVTNAKVIWSGKPEKHRWWNEMFCVADVDGMLIGYLGAESTGDKSPEDRGWEFSQSSICEVVAKEITTTIYEPIP